MNIDCIVLLTLASFCSIIFDSVTSHTPKASTDLPPYFERFVRERPARSGSVGSGRGLRLDRESRASLSSSNYSEIFNTTPARCTPFIPPAAYQAMLRLNSNLLQSTNLTIPEGYLYDCLSSIHYDRQIPAYVFLSPDVMKELTFSMTLSELVGYEFDGKLTLKVNIEYGWLSLVFNGTITPPLINSSGQFIL